MNYDVKVEAPSPAIRTMTVTIDADEVERAFTHATRAVARTAVVPGFRPGKVPAALLTRHHGETIRSHVQSALLDATLAPAIEGQNLFAVARPEVTVGVLKNGAMFTYVARIEVRPEVVLTQWQGLAVPRPEIAFSDADHEAALRTVRREASTIVPVTDRQVVQADDMVVCDYHLEAEGQRLPRSRRENTEIDLSGDDLIPGLAEGLIGATVPGPHQVTLTLPKGAGGPVAGKTLTIVLELRELKARVLPALDDELAKDLGHENLAAMEASIRESGQAHVRQLAERAQREAIVAALVAANPLELPPTMVREEAERLAADASGNQSPAPDAVAAHMERAAFQVKSALLLLEVGRAAAIEVTDAEIDAKIEEMAAAYGEQGDQLRRAYADPSRREDVRYHLLEERAVAAVLAHAVAPAPAP